ncbi:MAG: DUF1624 domain-containing protein [Oscillospiraceae bacterium]|nr:DUF1624 domain-containing protein [Oscillospiraceae bacterium]
MNKTNNRIDIIDALRGFSVVLMVAHHLLYNLVAFLGAPGWMFSNPVFDILQPFFAGLFIFLSGISSRFSRSNIKRGLIALGLSAVITAATAFMGMPIWWGVLHLLGFSMLFFGLTHRLWDLIPNKISPFIWITLIIAGAVLTNHITIICPHPWLRPLISVLGWRQIGFVSYDYFPIIPWLFVFLLGTCAGIYVRDRALPEWFYEYKVPLFPKIGRHALLIYIIHQPILYGLVIGIQFVKNLY